MAAAGAIEGGATTESGVMGMGNATGTAASGVRACGGGCGTCAADGMGVAGACAYGRGVDGGYPYGSAICFGIGTSKSSRSKMMVEGSVCVISAADKRTANVKVRGREKK